MLRSSFVDAVGQFGPLRPGSEGRLIAAVFDPAPALPYGMRIPWLCAGLLLCVTLIAVTAPYTKGLRNVGVHNNGSHDWNKNIVLSSKDLSGASEAITPSLSTHTSYRRLDRRCREAGPRFRRVRYSHIQRHRHCHQWSPRRHIEIPYLFLQPQYWGEARLTSGAAEDDIDLPGLSSPGTSTALIVGPSSAFGGSKTSFGGMGDGVSSAGILGWITDENNGTLALSGGSISGTSNVMVNADGTLQLSVTPNWAFIAKFDGAFAPEPQISAAFATVQYTW